MLRIRWSKIPALPAIGMILATFAMSANGLDVDADATGNWFDPTQSGHGLQIEMLDLSQAAIAWYTFDPQGDPLWLMGVGEVAGDTINAELVRFEGTGFPPAFDPEEITATTWGEVSFQRTGCDRAVLDYTPFDDDYQAGTLILQRLTRIDASRCHQAAGHDQETSWNLDRGRQEFEALFLDYWDGEEERMELDWGHEPLPQEGSGRHGIRISGRNLTDDLMMVLMRPLDGLEPDTRYRIELEMQFATNVPSGCAGVGGSPGESVFMRLGAAGEKPDYELVEEGSPDTPPMRRATIDLGQQASPGERALSVGDMANGLDDSYCTDPDSPWRLKRVSTAGQYFDVTTDGSGRIWVYGLSDSGFEATTTWYMTDFVVRLSSVEPESGDR